MTDGVRRYPANSRDSSHATGVDTVTRSGLITGRFSFPTNIRADTFVNVVERVRGDFPLAVARVDAGTVEVASTPAGLARAERSAEFYGAE